MRLFVGLDLPADLRRRLGALAHHAIPGARWVPEENYHLTIRFIGEAPAWRAEEIDHALSGLRARGFTLTLAGVGTFGGKAGRGITLWAGVERSEPLEHLRAKVENALQRAGLEPERRRFSPHVTLARLENPPEAKLGDWMMSNSLFRAEPVAVEHFTLFSSVPGKDHAFYTPEAEYPLS